jgi:hypothetical protein
MLSYCPAPRHFGWQLFRTVRLFTLALALNKAAIPVFVR